MLEKKMAARAKSSKVVYLPPVADEHFLKNTVEMLDRLREESEMRGRHMLASLLEIAKSEAEDDLKTYANRLRMLARVYDGDDGAAMMAQKPACRGAKEAQQG